MATVSASFTTLLISNRPFLPPYKHLACLVGALLLTTSVHPTPCKAHEQTSVGACFFENSNGTSASSSDGCEIVGGMHQGFFCYEVRFNAKRQYVACGGHDKLRFEDAPASLNNKPAKFSMVNTGDEYPFWCLTVKNPYHKVCFKQ